MSLQQVFNVKLTNSQREAIEKLEAFLESNANCFVLTGYAGTGKTFLLDKLSQYFHQIDQPFDFLSPTGRAARIIRERTNEPASTIHRKIYTFGNRSKIEVEEDKSVYKIHFKLRENEDPTNSIYIIDESSMVSDKYSNSETLTYGSGRLLSDLITFANIHETNRKIIFIGDPAQLPPVQSSFSPALSMEYLADQIGLTCEGYELTDVFRQSKDSEILSQATQLRNQMKTYDYIEFPVTANGQDIEEFTVYEAVSRYAANWKYTIFIASTNANVNKYNNMIREALGRKQLETNERLLITKNTFIQNVPLYNGDFVYTKWVSPEVEERTVRLKEKEENTSVTLKFRDLIVLAESNGRKVELKTKILENYLFSKNRGLSSLELRALIADFTMRHKNIQQNSELFKRELLNDPYFNALQVKFGYAITCHKSQGGEWDEVFIDFDFFNSLHTEDFFRWSYTAITRSKKQLYLVNLPKVIIEHEKLHHTERFENTNIAVINGLQAHGFNINDIFYHDNQIQYIVYNNVDHLRVSLWYNAEDIATSFTILDYTDEHTKSILSDVFHEFIGKSIASYANKEEENLEDSRLLKTDFILNHIKNSLQEIGVKLKNISFHNYLVKYTFITDSAECTINFHYNSKNAVTSVRRENGDEDLANRILEYLRF